ncbi:hypothetical protein PhaeoP18_02367 [Phaeobacter piscinae]|uniref:Uncharacterized protein n=1 Tax=Phaeobacter piscinae TaxID=1580596 RepID=A0AAN1GSC8_9RHOB|nr:hypothetical protein [Phaeobacter piscinae]ATG44302.1 hypothetical protein PhaeoP13_02388 [Phaeobacter piscinae]AUR36616.1 hypothetical protein PhaeoP18_02367 [Phaeobacter piscinae]
MTRQRGVNYIAFPILGGAAVLGLYWIWGLLFLWWLVPAVRSGQAHFVFEVARSEDPLLYWAVLLLWGLSGVMMIAASLFPQYAPWLV